MSEGRGIYQFDQFQLDPWRGVLVGQDGKDLRLRPKAFALLQLLLEHPGRLFGREELLRTLWPDVMVTDDSLTQCIGDLRQALGERAAEILRTVPRRGYRLDAAVSRVAPDTAPPAIDAPRPAPPERSAPPANLSLIRREALLLSPLQTQPGEELVESFAQILVSELRAELVRFDGLRVVANADAPSTTGFRLTGEARTVGTELRVLLQLEDLRTSTAFWADRLVLPVTQAAHLASDTLAALAIAIDLQIDRKSLQRARTKPAERLTARELCLLGRELHQHGTEAGTLGARQHFIRSAALDPGYADAHAWHAFSLMRVVTYGWGSQDWREARSQALHLSRMAVELEPESSLCLSALAFSLSLCEFWDEAVDTAHLALDAGRATRGTRTACGEVLTAAGRPEDAVRVLQEGVTIDPHAAPRTHAILGRALLLAGRPEDALEQLRRCAARLPDYAPCFRTMVVAAYEAGLIDDARMALREVARLQPNWLMTDKPIFWFLRNQRDIERFENAFQATQRLDAATKSGRLLKPGATRS